MILLEAREKTKRCARVVSKGLPVLIFPAVNLCFHARSKFLSLFVKIRSQFSPLSNSLLAPSRDVNLAQTHEIKTRKKLIDSFAAYAYSLLRSLNICPLTFGRWRKYSYAANELNFHKNLDHKHNLYQPLTIRRPNTKDIARSRTITVIYLFILFWTIFSQGCSSRRGWFEWGPYSLSPRGRTSLVSLPAYWSFTLDTGQLVNPCEIAL